MPTVLLRPEDGKRWMMLNGLNDGLPARSFRQSLIAVANTRVASNGAQPADKTEPPKPECHPESTTSKIAPSGLSRIHKLDPKEPATDPTTLAIAKAREASQGAQPTGKTEPPKLESRFESTTFKMALPFRPRSQDRDPMGLTADVPSREEIVV